MSQKYHQLKQTKYIWLRSQDSTVVRRGADNSKIEFQWDNIDDLKMSNNAVVSVCGFDSYNNMTAGRMFRCSNILTNQVYDTSHKAPIIYIAKTPNQSGLEMEPVKYNIGNCEKWKSINFVIETVKTPNFGIPDVQEFVIGLKFEDYDVIEVQPKLMNEMKDYHKLPQDRLQQKYI